MARRTDKVAAGWRQHQPGLRDRVTGLPSGLGPFELRKTDAGLWQLDGPTGPKPLLGVDDPFVAFRLMLDRYEAWVRDQPVTQVYFIGESAEMLGLVKIGVAQNVESRLGNLQVGNPRALRVLAQCAGDEALEAQYHRRFKLQRRSGEWFVINTAILAEIERLNSERK